MRKHRDKIPYSAPKEKESVERLVPFFNKNAGRNTLYTRVIELMFKRYVISSTTRPPNRVFFGSEKMNIYVFSDESGVFYQVHNDVFVFGGIVLLSKDEKEKYMRKYSAAERSIKNLSDFQKILKQKRQGSAIKTKVNYIVL